MDADPYTIDELFRKQIVYEVPIYQRLYVWSKENHWQPLWDDMQRMAEIFLAGEEEPKIHFLGASVQQEATGRTIKTHLVIDGQQRLTTLQLLLKAFRDVARKHNHEYSKKINKLIKNEDDEEKNPFKILSTISNQKDFSQVMKCQDSASLLEHYDYETEEEAELDKILAAYLFFHRSIHEWLGQLEESEESEESIISKKIESLYKAIAENAKLVVIHIDEGEDDAQLIFEKLNTGGKDLLASDLIKNSLLMELQKNDEDPARIEEAYFDYWKYFDDGEAFWQKEVKAGPGAKKATIEVYLKHVLTLLTKKEVIAHRIYKTYCNHAKNDKLGALHRMREIHKFGEMYEEMQTGYQDSKIRLFLERIHVMDGNQAYPFLFKLFDELDDRKGKGYLRKVLEDLESFIVRRKICGLNNKSYNSFFIDILDTLDGEPEDIPKQVRERLESGKSDGTKWPDDKEFKRAWVNMPLYRKLKATPVRLILEALEQELREYSESSLSNRLTIEHILPQAWDENESAWPFAKPSSTIMENGKISFDALAIASFQSPAERRNNILHTIGNLTLLDGTLNIKNSNKPWVNSDDPENEKRAMIKDHSNLHLNKKLWTQYRDKWDEDTIKERSARLFELAIRIWARPDNSNQFSKLSD